MIPFVKPEPIPWETYDSYFRRLAEAIAEHYNEFIKELQDDIRPNTYTGS